LPALFAPPHGVTPHGIVTAVMAAPAQFYDCSRVDSAALPPAPCQVLLPIVPDSTAAAPNHQNHTHSQTIPDQTSPKTRKNRAAISTRDAPVPSIGASFPLPGWGGREDPRPLRLHLLRRARSEATQAPNPDRAASVLLREFWILNSIRDPLLVILDPWYNPRQTAGEE
jgi:hypothetical protein